MARGARLVKPLVAGSSARPSVDITDVAVVGDHRLRLSFADGTTGDVDFSGREWGGVLAH
jgi:hypothetical protein